MSNSSSPTTHSGQGIPCDLLVVDALVVTLDATQRVIENGAIAIRGNTVAAIGATADLRAQYRPAEVLHANGKIAMPGFINPHNHTPLMIVRGMIEDLNFAPAYTRSIPKVYALSHEETLALARLGAYEMLRAGATTVVDFYRHPKALLAAADEVGLRAVIGGRIHDADTADLSQGSYVHRTQVGEQTLRETMDLMESQQGRKDDRIRCDFGPHAADTCSKDLLAEVARLHQKRGGNVHTHLAQSEIELEHVKERDGLLPHELFEEVGLLNDKMIAAHCVFLDQQAIADVGRRHVNIAHAPHQNARVGNIAPILALEKAGANITICTDTRSADMFEAMRLAIISARMLDKGKEPKAPRALSWATRTSAKALGLAGVNGMLEVGGKADIILVDQYAPNLVPFIDGYGILVHSGQSLNVKTVIVDGRIRLEDGEPVGFDGQDISRQAQAVAERLWSEQGGHRSIAHGFVSTQA